MTANSDLVERISDLKRELIDFSHHRRFDRAARTAVEERFGRYPVLDEEQAINFQTGSRCRRGCRMGAPSRR